MSQGIENVFRPPYELASVVACMLAAAAVLITPAAFLLSTWQALGLAGVLVALLLPAVQAAREAARRASCFRSSGASSSIR